MGEKSDYHHVTKISSLKNGGYSSWECVGFPVLGAVESPQVIYLYQMQVVKHDDFKEVQVIARRFLVWCAVLVGFTVGRPGMGVIFWTRSSFWILLGRGYLGPRPSLES